MSYDVVLGGLVHPPVSLGCFKVLSLEALGSSDTYMMHRRYADRTTVMIPCRFSLFKTPVTCREPAVKPSIGEVNQDGILTFYQCPENIFLATMYSDFYSRAVDPEGTLRLW